MDLTEIRLKGGDWFKRWEAMMNAYIPRRVERFDVMLEWADLPRRRPARILDLGCGPGSLAFRAARAYPRARVVAVDFDPILLAIGRRQNETEVNLVDTRRTLSIKTFNKRGPAGQVRPKLSGGNTAEEQFRLRRNQPLNMAPSAPKDRYCRADFFAQLFQNKSIFLGPGKCFTGR